MARVTLIVAFLTLLPVACHALTASELSKMASKGTKEQNTGLSGSVKLTTEGDYYVLTSNGIPDHNTGTFPAKSNPNSIQAQSYSYKIPKNPSVADETTCLPMGVIGFAKNGVPIFSPFSAEGEDAVTTETFDSCEGHPDQRGSYHYHHEPECVHLGNNDEFVGVALDGFPIYGVMDESGKKLTSADLDDCHGRTMGGVYRYHVTDDYPYLLGCFKGTPSPSIPSRMLSSKDCRFASVGDKNAGSTPGWALFTIVLNLGLVIGL